MYVVAILSHHVFRCVYEIGCSYAAVYSGTHRLVSCDLVEYKSTGLLDEIRLTEAAFEKPLPRGRPICVMIIVALHSHFCNIYHDRFIWEGESELSLNSLANISHSDQYQRMMFMKSPPTYNYTRRRVTILCKTYITLFNRAWAASVVAFHA